MALDELGSDALAAGGDEHLSAPPTRRFLNLRGYLAIGVILVLLVGAITAAVVLTLRTGRTIDLLRATEGTISSISRVVGGVADAETGQRGYLLTQREIYLAPYESGLSEARESLAELSRPDGPHLIDDADLNQLRTTVQDKLAELRDTLSHARAGDRDAAIQVVQSDRGLDAMRAIRALTARLVQGLRRQADRELTSVLARGDLLVAVQSGSLAFAILLAFAVGLGVRRAIRALRTTQVQLLETNRQMEALNERLEETVNRRTADLSAANEEIQRFAYIVSHDLRAPLVNIMGFTGELEVATSTLSGFIAQVEQERSEGLPRDVAQAAHEDLPEAIGFIRTSTAKMDRLIGAILKLSREGRRVLTAEPIDMTALLSTIADTLRHQAEQKGAQIVVEPLPPLTGDRVMMEQIFSNVVENALKYGRTDRPVRVTITGAARNGKAIYEVRDNGRGIAPHDLERIFELFRRAGDQTVPGEGIGLAHVRALVRRLGGRIDCESAEGVGSVFTIQLPIVARDTNPAAEAQQRVRQRAPSLRRQAV